MSYMRFKTLLFRRDLLVGSMPGQKQELDSELSLLLSPETATRMHAHA